MPPFVYGFLVLYLGMGLAVLISGIRVWRQAARASLPARFRTQFTVWVILLVGGAILMLSSHTTVGLLMFLGSQFLPRNAGKVSPLGP